MKLNVGDTVRIIKVDPMSEWKYKRFLGSVWDVWEVEGNGEYVLSFGSHKVWHENQLELVKRASMTEAKVNENMQNENTQKENTQKEYYVGCKLVKAAPRSAYNNHAGYEVMYTDGYMSWSPKETFEKYYLKVGSNRDLPSQISINQKMVDDFIDNTDISTIGDKTTLVRCILKNGFELVEADRKSVV